MIGVFSNQCPLPEESGEDKHVTEYADGTRILVDRSEHVVEIKDSYGSFIRMENGDIIIKSARHVRIN